MHKIKMRHIITFVIVFGIFVIPSVAQSNYKNAIGFSPDVITTLGQTYNLSQSLLSGSLNFSFGTTLYYERKIYKDFYGRLKFGYYKVQQRFNFPGELPLIDHSLNNIGLLVMDAAPMGANLIYRHQINAKLSINFNLGIISYMLFRPIPSTYLIDLNPYLKPPLEGDIYIYNYTGNDIYSKDFIHSWEMGFGLHYSISPSNKYQLFFDNTIRVGFRPYYNYEITIFSGGIPPPNAFVNEASLLVSYLNFSSIGIRYEF